MKISHRIFFSVAFATCFFSLTVGAAPITLVEAQQSKYSIYYDINASKPVKQAATELQRVIKVASGATLPVVTQPASPMIALGVTEAARNAGAVPAALPENGYVIATKGQDIFILGQDTPEGQEKWPGIDPQNTVAGVYAFCEKAVGARWLFPGPLGEDIPVQQKISFEPLNISESAAIRHRSISTHPEFAKLPVVNEWKIRNKLVTMVPGAIPISWGHSFNDFPKAQGAGLEELMREHPEWMALQKDGTRARIPAGRAYSQWKYCMTNPELVKAFAEGVIERFDKNPKMFNTSISPSDGYNWCHCENCQKYTMPIAAEWKALGLNDPQYTPLVLKFYNEVARLVAKKHPDRVLGAMVYQDYLVPLEKPIPLEKNLLVGIAVNSGYGFKYYKPEREALFRKVYSEWGKYGAQLGLTDYSTWMRNWFGFPMPLGRELMKSNLELYRAAPPHLLHYYGYESMGNGGAHNYVVGKLMWDAKSDPDVLFREFLVRAYGKEATVPLEEMDALIEASVKKYILENPKPDHELDYNAVKAIYAPIFPQIEELYFKAVAAPKTELQKKRLEMVGDNLIMSHFHLRKAGLASKPLKSRLYMSHDDFEEWLKTKTGTLSIINLDQWVNTYKHAYSAPPILRQGWKPR